MPKNILRIVVDTNLLVSSVIVPQSLPDKLVRSWLRNSFTLLTCSEQIEEIKDVSQRKKLKVYPNFEKRMIELIENVEFVAEIISLDDKDFPVHSRDPKDDIFLACAIFGKADYIITGDDDLLVLNGDPGLEKLKIITIREFLG